MPGQPSAEKPKAICPTGKGEVLHASITTTDEIVDFIGSSERGELRRDGHLPLVHSPYQGDKGEFIFG